MAVTTSTRTGSRSSDDFTAITILQRVIQEQSSTWNHQLRAGKQTSAVIVLTFITTIALPL